MSANTGKTHWIDRARDRAARAREEALAFALRPEPRPRIEAPVQPAAHPDDGKALGKACKPAMRPLPTVQLVGDAWHREIEQARRADRAPRQSRRRRPLLTAPQRAPTVADLLRMREAAVECARKIHSRTRSTLVAGPTLAVVLSACGVLTVLDTREGRSVDPTAASVARLPAVLWSTWALLGWRSRWSRWSCHAGSRWLGKRDMPGLKWRGGWRRLWMRQEWAGCRLLTAQEWGARTGSTIPGWLRRW